MADRIESYQHTIGQQGAAERDQLPIDATGERSVMAEFADAAQSTAEALQKQKQQIADRVSGMAEALECAAHSLDQSQNRIIGRNVQGRHDARCPNPLAKSPSGLLYRLNSFRNARRTRLFNLLVTEQLRNR
jgi:hypothetical protein